MFKLSVLLPQSHSPPLLSVLNALNLQEKEKKLKLIGNKFQSENYENTDTATFKDTVQSVRTASLQK